MLRIAFPALFMVLLAGCSHTHEMLWWDMMESHQEFSRVTALVKKEQAEQSVISDSVIVLTDSAVAYIERLEAVLFAAADQEDRRDERSHEPDADAYYDYRSSTELLIGEEPAAPRQGVNSAHALRMHLENHKRLMEQVATMRKGELDIYLSTDNAVTDYSGTLVPWETGAFYHVPLATVIERLTRMKIAVRQMEHAALLRRRADNLLLNGTVGSEVME